VGSAIARKKYSLCCSIGFNMLTKLSNAAQDEAESPAQGGSTLFQDEGTAQKKQKRVYVSRLEAQSKRAEPDAMDMDITVQGKTYSIKVLQKVVGRDAVYVRYDPEDLGPVVQFMRTNGFTEKHKSYFKHQGAKGLWRRTNGFVVKRKGYGGKNSYKLVKGDLDEAVMMQNLDDPDIEDGDQDTPGAVSAVADSGKPGEEEDAPAGEKNEEEEAEKPAEDEGGHDDEKPAEEKAVKTAGTVTKRQVSLAQCWAK